MPVQLYGGTMASFADSMAEEMDLAFAAVRTENGLEPLGDDDRKALKLLFLAVARGVINHMKKKEQAFAVSVDGTHPASGFPSIQVKPSP
jgi:hypothetical protein